MNFSDAISPIDEISIFFMFFGSFLLSSSTTNLIGAIYLNTLIIGVTIVHVSFILLLYLISLWFSLIYAKHELTRMLNAIKSSIMDNYKSSKIIQQATDFIQYYVLIFFSINTFCIITVN